MLPEVSNKIINLVTVHDNLAAIYDNLAPIDDDSRLETFDEESSNFPDRNSIRSIRLSIDLDSIEPLCRSKSDLFEDEKKNNHDDGHRQSKNNNEKKTVSISPHTPDFKEIDHINDLKQELDITTLWYTDEEYDTIRMECSKTILLMNNGYDITNEHHHYCTRGLEQLTIHGKRQYGRNIYTASKAVFQEQSLQRKEGIYDAEFLADMYFEQSWQSQIDSQNRGIRDYKEVVTMQDEESRIINLISKLAFL